MNQNSFKFNSLLSICLIGLTCLITSISANSADLKFSYTSDTDGFLGYFTVNESIFNENVDSPYVGYLQNKFIKDLSFSYRGFEYGVDDITINDYTIFETFADLSLPTVQGGSGYLATFGGNCNIGCIVGRPTDISLFRPTDISLLSSGLIRMGFTDVVTGNWATSYVAAVPEPQTYFMLVSGLLLLGLSLRKNHKY